VAGAFPEATIIKEIRVENAADDVVVSDVATYDTGFGKEQQAACGVAAGIVVAADFVNQAYLNPPRLKTRLPKEPSGSGGFGAKGSMRLPTFLRASWCFRSADPSLRRVQSMSLPGVSSSRAREPETTMLVSRESRPVASFSISLRLARDASRATPRWCQ
jgi:hypothetical protein